MNSTFYGRDELLETLAGFHGSARRGEPQFVVLKGPTGIGKTRLIQEFYRQLVHEYDVLQPGFESRYWPESLNDRNSILEINPVFDDRKRPPIPFLFWGIRCRADDLSGAALHRAMPYLAIHTSQTIVRRNIGKINSAAVWRVLSWLASAAGYLLEPVLSILVNFPVWIRDGIQASRARAERQKEKKRLSNESVADAKRRQEKEKVAEALDSLQLFLDRNIADAPTIPVVLFIDDAHWADDVTIQVVHSLWNKALINNWELTILATYWDDEWTKQDIGADTENPFPLPRLFDFGNAVRSFEHQPIPWLGNFDQPLDPKSRLTLIQMGGVADDALKQWIADVLPGLPDDQCQLLIEKARFESYDRTGHAVSGGSPRVLGYMMRWLLEDVKNCFVAGDSSNALSTETVKIIKNKLFDERKINELRFENLKRDVQTVLGWSSIQGKSFFADLLAEAVRNRKLRLGADVIKDVLSQPLVNQHWIEPLDTALDGRNQINSCCFRATIFYEIAWGHIGRNREELESIESAMDAVLRDWLRNGRLDRAIDRQTESKETMTRQECHELLRMCVKRFRPVSGTSVAEEQWMDCGNGLAKLVKWNIVGDGFGHVCDWNELTDAASEFVSARLDGWPTQWVAIELQLHVVDALIAMRDFLPALRILTQLKFEFDFADDWVALSEYLGTVEKLAEVLVETGSESIELAGEQFTPMTLLEHSLEWHWRVSTSLGATQDGLLGLSLTLERIAEEAIRTGQAAIRVGDRSHEPIELFAQSVLLCKQAVEKFGASAKSLGGLSDSQIALAEEMGRRDFGKFVFASRTWERYELLVSSFYLNKKILQEFGETYDALLAMGDSMKKLGAAAASLGIVYSSSTGHLALAMFTDSLALQKRIIQRFGETPDDLSALSIALQTLAGEMLRTETLQLEIDETEVTPISLYQEGLEISRKVIAQWGVWPRELSGLAIAYGRLATAMVHLGQSDVEIKGQRHSTKALYQRSLEIFQQIVDDYGETPERLRNLEIARQLLSQDD
jgi:hypothetical protein